MKSASPAATTPAKDKIATIMIVTTVIIDVVLLLIASGGLLMIGIFAVPYVITEPHSHEFRSVVVTILFGIILPALVLTVTQIGSMHAYRRGKTQLALGLLAPTFFAGGVVLFQFLSKAGF